MPEREACAAKRKNQLNNPAHEDLHRRPFFSQPVTGATLRREFYQRSMHLNEQRWLVHHH
jgi:hypothetical protein